MAKALGLRRVGQYGGPVEIAGERLVAQAKSGGSFPERIWRWLQIGPGERRQTPGSSSSTRRAAATAAALLVIVSLEDWTALHAGEAEA
jgi:hypothetical protein